MKKGFLLVSLLASFASSCAHVPVGKVASPGELLRNACSVGRGTTKVWGRAWLKARSKDASGQFPADVRAEAPASLQLEVTNLMGGTEAIIGIQGQEYRIEMPQRKARTEKGYGSWAGIPLRWATELMLGRVPCPVGWEKITTGQVSVEGELVVETPKTLAGDRERFIYRFRQVDEAAWPEALRWERFGAFATVVEFKFDRPSGTERSPERWEANSAQGEVALRWSERKFEVAGPGGEK